MRKISSLVLSVSLFFVFASSVSAHATVSPREVGVGKYQTFSLGVPVEQEQSTIAVRLVIPEGMSVIPNVKPGWKIEIKKEGSGHDAKVKEISWTGGKIDTGMRDEFLFSSKTPGSEVEIVWKAYQTYADGSVVSWDADPKVEQPKNEMGESDFSKIGPYSVTKVVNDLAVAKPSGEPTATEQTTISKSATYLSVLAVAFSAMAFYNSRRKAS